MLIAFKNILGLGYMEYFFCFDICAALVLFMLVIAQFIRKMTKGRTNMLFIGLAMSVMITSILNIWDGLYGYTLTISAYNLYLRYFINYMYFIIRNAAPVIYILYICSFLGVWHRLRSSGYKFVFWIAPYALEVILLTANFFNKKMFYFDEDMLYTRGDWIISLYIIAIYYIILTMIIIVINRRLITSSKLMILLLFLPVNGLAVIVQLMYPMMRIDNFATAIAVLAMSIEVQRPEETMDTVIGCENYNSFVTQIGKIYKTQDPKSLLLIRFVNHALLRGSIGHDKYTLLLQTIVEKLYQIDKVMKCGSSVYYIDQGAFAIVAPGKKYEEVLDMGRMLGSYTQEPLKVGPLEVMLDARICLVKIPDEIGSYDSLLNFASTFHNKIPNQKRVMSLTTVADSKDFRMRNDMDTIINRGIAKYNFQMYYQPIYSIEKGKFVSAEALIRLEDEQYGFVSPALFIPEAEESGAIHQIGDFVLEDVCRFIGSSDFEALGLEYIEVNLSVGQCMESDLFEKIDALMEKYGVLPSQINLEITETGVDYDPVTTDRNISLLTQKGITFSLDDYGTGYSSIKRVVTLPLNIVKLDKSLVDDMDSPLMWIVITNTVNMLKRMDKKILVEGVETKRALDKFTELGCDYIQGYYFSKPLNESQFLKFIISKNFGVEI